MISVGTILTILAIIIILAILYKLFVLGATAIGISDLWRQIIYWVLVLIVVVWALGALGITQPIIR